MSFSLRFTNTMREGDVPISNEVIKNVAEVWKRDEPVADGVTDQSLVKAILVSKINCFKIVSDRDMTLETNSPGVNEVQTITITGSPAGGTFPLTLDGQTTSPEVDYDATAGEVQTALEGLSNVAPGDVVCAGGPLPGTPVTVTFGGAWANQDVPTMTTSSGNLTGGTSPTVAITTTTPGVAPGNSFELLANDPFEWRGHYFDNPFTVDITGFYLSNASGEAGTVKFRFGLDA